MKINKYITICLGVLVPFILFAQGPPKPEKLTWTHLGMTAQLNNDFFTHVFHLRKNAGVFSKLEFRINGIFILDWVLVQYEDGATWSPTEYPAIAIRKSYAFTLPDNGKMVKSVEIRYHDVGGPINTAAVSLWGGRAKEPKS